STGLPGPQIEQVSAQALPSDFSAFLAQQRVSKLESHFAARATASCTTARHGRILARDSAASWRTRPQSSFSKAPARAAAASGWHFQAYLRKARAALRRAIQPEHDSNRVICSCTADVSSAQTVHSSRTLS